MKKDRTPLVSIVVPIYNAVAFLKPTLDSICNQDYRNLEIILVNDGSTDETYCILEEYAQRDSRIRIINKSNAGAAVARNAGLELVSGEYVLVLDSDDIFLPHMVTTMVTRAVEQESDVVVCNAIMHDNDTDESWHNVCQDMEWASKCGLDTFNSCPRKEASACFFQIFKFGVAWNKLLSVRFVRKHGLWFQVLSSSNDFYFSHAALILANRVSIIDEELVRYQIRSGSVSHSKKRDISNPLRAVIAVKEKMRELQCPNDMFHSLTLFAMDLLGWNLHSTSASPETVCQLLNQTVHEFPDSRLYGYSYDESLSGFGRLFVALHHPTISLILPHVDFLNNSPLLESVSELISNNQYPIRVLYAVSEDERIPSPLLNYPIALPVKVNQGATLAERIMACRDFPVPFAEHEVWPGCDLAPIYKIIAKCKRALLFNRLCRVLVCSRTKRKQMKERIRKLRAQLKDLNLLLKVISVQKV